MGPLKKRSCFIGVLRFAFEGVDKAQTNTGFLAYI